MKTSGRLQDIETWINIVQEEKTRGSFYKFFNRLGLPYTWKLSTNEWLEILNREKDAELVRLGIKKVYGKRL